MLSRPSPDDASHLPDALAPRDAAAFQRAFDAYLDPLRRFVFTYVASWETAEELVNDTFLQLWRRLQDGEPVRELKAYLYAAARNHALNHLRRRRIETHHLREYLAPRLRAAGRAVPPQAEDEIITRDLAAAIQRAVDELPPRQRDVVLLKWQRQATQAEIGHALGIAPKTVGEHFRRAVERLRAVLPTLLAHLR